MKNHSLPPLFIAILFFATGQNLAAQSGNSNVGNTSGLFGNMLQENLTATDANGNDVSTVLTATVGQPVSVTFTLSGANIPAGSWSVNLVNTSNPGVSPPYYNIAPGLTIANATLVYATITATGPPVTARLLGSASVQLVGTPTTAGLYDIVLTAFQLSGFQGAKTPNFDYYMRVNAAPATTFTTQPASQSIAVGQSVTFTAAAAGSPTYQWSGPNGVIAGAAGASLTLTNVQMSAAGAYSVTATVAGSFVTSNSATLTVLPLAAPAFTKNPVSVTVASGHSAVFNATASGELPPTYQWSFNGTPISGATDPVLEIPGATSVNAGAYTCTATNSSGSATSTSATLAVTTTSTAGYLINLSARANVGTGNNILIGGFGVAGAGTKQLLVRGVGPALSVFFNTDLAMPQLVLLDNSGEVVSTGLAWGRAVTPVLSPADEAPVMAGLPLMNSLGAFPYTAGSADTATVLTMPPGNNTAQVSGVGGTSGIGLCEIYDADAGTPTARLINISARADVGTGDNILIGGFAIGGTTAETVLIRAVGPGLNDTFPSVFPLSTVLNQPVLTLLQGSTTLATNTVWGGDATIAGVANAVGAFPLNAAHADSLLLVTLPPGNYTAQVSGLNGGTGIALCEVYEVP